MDIGLVVPNTDVELDGASIPDWARRAEAAGFSTVAVADRVAYASHDGLITLTVAGAVTSRIRPLTNVLLGPTRNPVPLAKQTATLDRISRGCVILGIAERWDGELEVLLHDAWAGKAVGGSSRAVAPRPTNGAAVPILLGGRTPPAIRRMARWGIGLSMCQAGPDQFGTLLPRIQTPWKAAGRTGVREIVGYAQYALGKQPEAGAARYIRDEYGSQFYDRAEEMERTWSPRASSTRM